MIAATTATCVSFQQLGWYAFQQRRPLRIWLLQRHGSCSWPLQSSGRSLQDRILGTLFAATILFLRWQRFLFLASLCGLFCFQVGTNFVNHGLRFRSCCIHLPRNFLLCLLRFIHQSELCLLLLLRSNRRTRKNLQAQGNDFLQTLLGGQTRLKSIRIRCTQQSLRTLFPLLW